MDASNMKIKEINRDKLKEYNLYAGLGGGFGGASYQYTSVFESLEEAEREAYELACEEYESYSGDNSFVSYEEAYSEALENLPVNATEDEIEEYVDEVIQADRENWIEYKAIPTEEDSITEDELIRDYTISDDDSSSRTSSQAE